LSTSIADATRENYPNFMGPIVLFLALMSPASGYDDMRVRATVVDRLASTVAALVGTCPDGLLADELEECRKNLGTAAKAWAGRPVVVALGAVEPGFLSVGSWTAAGITLVWTPLFDLGNELALTIGRPEKLSPTGSIVVARRPFRGHGDPGLSDTDLQRAVKAGNVAVELVGTFGKPWQLQGAGRTVRGIAFQPSAIRFLHVRTGKVLVEVVDPK
jgi:hypothetical protein